MKQLKNTLSNAHYKKTAKKNQIYEVILELQQIHIISLVYRKQQVKGQVSELNFCH